MEGEKQQKPQKKGPALPDLKRYMEKRVLVRLTGGRRVTGVLTGFDQFMNLVLNDGAEEIADGTGAALGQMVIRGDMVINLEQLQA